MALTEHILDEVAITIKAMRGNPGVLKSIEEWGKRPADAKLKLDIYSALELAGADSWLLGIVGSWGDTLPDEEVLKMLAQWNRRANISEHNGKSQISR